MPLIVATLQSELIGIFEKSKGNPVPTPVAMDDSDDSSSGSSSDGDFGELSEYIIKGLIYTLAINAK